MRELVCYNGWGLGCFVWLRCSSVFFFKQKPAYEMLRGLVGSEMCIRAGRPNKMTGDPL